MKSPWLAGFCWLLCSTAADAQLTDATGVEFFEQKIRPVLVQRCQECHSATAEAANQLKGGLRVDSRAALLTGGDSGPAIVPGQPDESLLIAAIRYESFEMPPQGRLPDDVVANFVKWIEMGAPDPREDATPAKTKREIDLEAGRQFWCFRPPQSQAAPMTEDQSWADNDIDRFILAQLESRALRPAAAADRTTLIRRLYFDVVGLPPSPEEIDAFVADESTAAYERLVDRLLASPQFGERWGRHWLDVVRFAESLTLRGFILKDAWRYRDFVIDAMNDDLPFDQFVREQIAGDLLQSADEPLEVRRRHLIATTFLVLGNTNLEEQDKQQLVMDVVDEQLDTIGKSLLAQTIGCARCHDHKFDPIPTRDYYALAGILKNSKSLEHSNVSKWMEVPLPMTPEREAAVQRHLEQVAAIQSRIGEIKKLVQANDPKGSKGVVAIADLMGVAVDDAQAKKVGAWKDSQVIRPFVGDGYIHDDAAGKGEKTLTFVPRLPAAGMYEVRLSYTPGSSRSAAVPVTVFSADGEMMISVNQQKTPPIDGLFVDLGRYRFEANGQGYVLISTEGTTGHVTADAVLFVPIDQQKGAPAALQPAASAEVSPEAVALAASLKQMEEELKQLQATGPKRDTTISVVEEPEIKEVKIHIRGSVHNQGESAPRGFLRVASHSESPAMPANQSGRKELAQWLTDPAQPLLARVYVNRVWHWLLGAGLVRTTDNFGVTGETPSHPELLDELALRFVRNGWSTKQLVRELVCSHTYRQSTATSAESAAVDPDNRLLSRMSRRRLDAESLRDALLTVSGRLDLSRGGPGFREDLASDFGFQDQSLRRSVYVPVFRNALPDLFEVFDFPDSSTVMGSRTASTVAPQALYLMNHSFPQEMARHAATRMLQESSENEVCVERAYRWTLGRVPTPAERDASLRFVVADPQHPIERWTALFQSLFASIEFRYIH